MSVQTANDRALESLKHQQRVWARDRGYAIDTNGYCLSRNDNVFGGLSAEALEDFSQGAGAELGEDNEIGKFQALHSSSALACNWFDYWRKRDLQMLSHVLGAPTPLSGMRLEGKLPTGVRGSVANVDVLFTATDDSLFAIESKFGEPYSVDARKTHLKPAYFEGGRQRWSDLRLLGCQRVADSLHRGGHRFKTLDVAQLLKHMLALANTGREWTLLCLWFDVPGMIATKHRAELQHFIALLGEDAAHFRAVTYQELFDAMLPHLTTADDDYIEYLKVRYMRGPRRSG